MLKRVNGEIKLFCTAVVLNFRRRFPHLFLRGDYVPLAVEGEHDQNVVALSRQSGRDAVIAIVPRLTAAFSTPASPFPLGEEVWKNTAVVLDGVLRQ